MSTTIQGTSPDWGTTLSNLSALTKLAAEQATARGDTTTAGLLDSARLSLAHLLSDQTGALPDLEKPATSQVSSGGLTLGGLSLETLLDAVGMEQRRTETKAGISSLEARAQERAMANDEKLKSIQEQLEKSRSQGILDGFLKAFKIIGMVLSAIASVAMITAGAVGMAAGGSGALLIGLGVASLYMTIDSAVQMGTDGKVGIGLGSAVGAIVTAAGGSKDAAEWTRFAVDMLVSVAMMVVGGLAAAGKIGSSAVKATADAASAASKASATADKLEKAASMTARVTTGLSGANTIANSATSIASAKNEKDISYLIAQQKHLQAILERIAMANDLDIEHLKEIMERSEKTLRQVSDIVQEGVQTNTAIMTGNPAMA